MFWYRTSSIFCIVVTCLVALATGCGDVSGHVEWEQRRDLRENHTRQTAGVAPDAVRDQAGVVIQSPAASFTSTVERCEVYGRFNDIPDGWQIYALLESPHGFFLQWPPVRIDPTRRTFVQRNIRIGHEISGLHIALADHKGAEILDSRASRNDWSAMPMLPDGVVICDTVAFE